MIPSYFRIVLMYILFACLWMVVTDSIISGVSDTPDKLRLFERVEGIGFIAVTAILLFFERKHAERSRTNMKQQFRMMVDFTYDWEYWLSPTRKLLFVSPSCQRITGYTVEEFLANPELLNTIIHTGGQPYFNRPIIILRKARKG